MLRKKLIRRFESRFDFPTGKWSTVREKTESQSDRRKETKARGVPRFDARLVASIEIDESSYVGFTENVSQAGVFVATQAPQQIGAVVKLLIALPDLAVVRAEGTVRWIRRSSTAHGVSAGMGIRFEKLSALDAIRMQDFVRARQTSLLDGSDDRLRSA